MNGSDLGSPDWLRDLIARHAREHPSRDQTIADEHLHVTWRELPDALRRLDRHLRSLSSSPPSDLLAIEAPSPTGALLLLLTCMTRGRGSVLFGASGTQGPLPDHCQTVVSWRAAQSTDCSEISIRRNPSWNGNASDNWQGRFVCSSTGSTGEPKWIVHSASRLWQNADHCRKRLQLEASDRIYVPVPIHHLYGLNVGALPAILAGAGLQLQSQTNLVRYVARERSFEPTVTILTPTLCRMLLARRGSTHRYRLATTGGERIDEQVFRRFDGRFGRLTSLYGSTEMCLVAASEPEDSLDLRSAGSISLLPGVESRIDSLAMTEEDPREGQLHLRSDHRFLGMLSAEGWQTASEWFDTGDVAERAGGDRLRVVGRHDGRIKRRNLLVSVDRIESVLERAPGIEAVAIVPFDRGGDGDRLAAFFVAEPGTALDVARLRRLCSSLLPSHSVPDRLFLLPDLPVGPTRKVDRKELTRIAAGSETNPHESS